MMLESQLDKWCDKLDRDYSEVYPEELYLIVEKEASTQKITQLWNEEMIFRKKYYLNFLISATGQQGRAFKSIFLLVNAFKLGTIFGVPFDINKHTLIDPYDLDYKLKHTRDSTTLLVDEKKMKNVDVGSSTTYFSLMDYEFQGRATQKNILLATPNLYDERHYFIFREHSAGRVSNPKCAKCSHNMKCHREPLNTMCSIPFHKREGYPSHMSFMMYTHPKINPNVLKPRGIVTYSVPTPNTFIAYDKVKKKILRNLNTDKSGGWDRFMKEAEKVFKKNPRSFTKELKDGRIVPAAFNYIQFQLREHGLHGKYPKAVIEYMAYKITDLVNQKFG